MLKEADVINAYKEFKKSDSNRKKIQVGENIYVDLKKGKKGNRVLCFWEERILKSFLIKTSWQ